MRSLTWPFAAKPRPARDNLQVRISDCGFRNKKEALKERPYSVPRLVDLHTHSTASDGSLSPRDLVRYAKKKGAAAISLTDHDTVEGLEEALSAGQEQDLEVIPGLEISAHYKGGTMHILGYYIDPSDLVLNQELLQASGGQEGTES